VSELVRGGCDGDLFGVNFFLFVCCGMMVADVKAKRWPSSASVVAVYLGERESMCFGKEEARPGLED
jgi:hypothetical protein